jgi:hypothetical protein
MPLCYRTLNASNYHLRRNNNNNNNNNNHVPRLKENDRSTNSAFIYENGSSAGRKAMFHEKWLKKSR